MGSIRKPRQSKCFHDSSGTPALQTAVKRPSAHAELPGELRDVPIATVKRPGQVALFEIRHRQRLFETESVTAGRGQRGREEVVSPLRQVFALDDFAIGKQRGALYQVAQFANVAGEALAA